MTCLRLGVIYCSCRDRLTDEATHQQLVYVCSLLCLPILQLMCGNDLEVPTVVVWFGPVCEPGAGWAAHSVPSLECFGPAFCTFS